MGKRNKYLFFLNLIFIYWFLIPYQGMAGIIGTNTVPDISAIRQKTGFIKIITNLDTLFVVFDNNFSSPQPVKSQSVFELSVGTHEILLLHKDIDDFKTKIKVYPDSSIDYVNAVFKRVPLSKSDLLNSSYPRVLHNANVVILSDDDSKIFIDNQFVGTGQIKTILPNGKHEVRTVHSTEGATSEEIFLSDNRLNVQEMYNKVPQLRYWIGSLLPCGGQFMKNQPIKGGLLLSLTAGLFTASIINQSHFVKDNNEYQRTLKNYKEAIIESEAQRLGNIAQSQLNLTKQDVSRRNIFLITGTLVYLYSLLDSFLTPPETFRIEQKFNLLGNSYLSPNVNGLSLVIPISK